MPTLIEVNRREWAFVLHFAIYTARGRPFRRVFCLEPSQRPHGANSLTFAANEPKQEIHIMTAFCQNQRICNLGVAPTPTYKTMCKTVNSHTCAVLHRYDFTQLSRIHYFLYFHKIGVVAHHMAHAHHHSGSACGIGYALTLSHSLSYGLLKQHMIADCYCLQRGLHMLVFWCAHKCGINATHRILEIIVSQLEAPVGWQAEFSCHRITPYVVRFHHGSQRHC